LGKDPKNIHYSLGWPSLRCDYFVLADIWRQPTCLAERRFRSEARSKSSGQIAKAGISKAKGQKGSNAKQLSRYTE
jgi:hypothetical protein